MEQNNMAWRTIFEPLPDITAYELALNLKHINGSDVLSPEAAVEMGAGALRHRVLADRSRRRMDEVYAEWVREVLEA
jgi:hypothetical protein